LENLEIEILEYKTVEKILVNPKKKFDRENNKTIKVVELKRVE